MCGEPGVAYLSPNTGRHTCSKKICSWDIRLSLPPGYLIGPPGKEIAVRLQVECVCVVQWEGAVHCALLHRNTDYVLRTQMLASSLQNSCRNVKVVQKLDRQCLVKVLSREMAGVCSHRTSSCHSSPEY